MTDRPRALAGLIAVFLLGGIIGAAGSYFWSRNEPVVPPGRAMQGFPPRPPGPGSRPRFSDMLGLSPAQQKRFREIMADSRKQLDTLRIEQAPRVDAIRKETNRKLMSVLDEDQKKKFAAIRKDMEARPGRRVRGGRGMPPP